MIVLSVLTMWGQTEPIVFNVDSVRTKVKYFRETKEDVIKQANNKINQEEKAIFNEKFENALNMISNWVDKYDNFKDSVDLKNKGNDLITKFIKDYEYAITKSGPGTEISINTKKFYSKVTEFKNSFSPLYNRINELLSNEGSSDDSKSMESSDMASTIIKEKVEISKIFPRDLWLSFILGFIGITGLGCSVIALIRLKKTNACLDKCIDELDELKTSQRKQIISHKKVNNTNSPEATNHPTIKSNKTRRKIDGNYEPPVVSTFPEPRTVLTPEPVLNPTPETPHTPLSYLYATTKNGSMEFSKVNDNNNDKVFMLILNKPDTAVADFTIVPNMDAVFKKSVIADRETYLPTTFCEKSIESQNPTEIEVVSNGTAKKVSGKWMVQTRLKIRFV